MNNYLDRLRQNMEMSMQAKRHFLEQTDQLEVFGKAVEQVVRAYQRGGRLYIAGNGGSAADAQHLAAEFVSKQCKMRAALPAEALTTDSSTVTAIGNDFGYDQIFSRQLAGKAQSADIFLGITTSGQSPNILRALEQARSMEIPSIVFCGNQGGKAKALADYCIVASGSQTSTIQELHIILCHTLCECVEMELFPG